MKSPEPISDWGAGEIGAWLRGLDGGLDKYKESLAHATGEQLLKAGVDMTKVIKSKFESHDFLSRSAKVKVKNHIGKRKSTVNLITVG